MAVDYIIGNQAYGDVGAMLLENNMDPGALRPAIDSKGRKYVRLYDGFTYNEKGDMVIKTKKKYLATNAPVTVPQEAWKQIDQAVVRASMPRLRFVNRLRSRNLTYSVPNAMGKTVLETQVMGRITPATISMDAVRRGDADQPESDIAHIPLPIIHKDAEFTARQIAVSRNSSMPFDTTYIEMASEEVAIEVERLALGTSVNNGYQYAGGTVWGLMNFPDRMTKPDMTAPTDTGWTPETTVNEVIAMRELARTSNVFGPFTLIVSPAWEAFLDKDYSANYPGVTLRNRLMQIDGVSGIESIDYIDDGGFHMILLQENVRTVRIILGMDIQTIQWVTQGGMVRNFKVMCIIVPQFRADIDGVTGIVHGTATPTP